MYEKIIKQIKEKKIIAIVRGISENKILPLANALIAGGINLIEVTFDQSSVASINSTVEMIHILNNNFDNDIYIGAGTVMNEKQVEMAVEAGAEFILSADVNSKVIKRTKDLRKISIPGAMTATEIAKAYEYGADIVKLFPAGLLGTSYVKAIKGPLKHIPLLAVGNINEKNISDFINAGVIGAGIGGNLVNKQLIKENYFEKITEIAKLYHSMI